MSPISPVAHVGTRGRARLTQFAAAIAAILAEKATDEYHEVAVSPISTASKCSSSVPSRTTPEAAVVAVVASSGASSATTRRSTCPETCRTTGARQGTEEPVDLRRAIRGTTVPTEA